MVVQFGVLVQCCYKVMKWDGGFAVRSSLFLDSVVFWCADIVGQFRVLVWCCCCWCSVVCCSFCCVLV